MEQGHEPRSVRGRLTATSGPRQVSRPGRLLPFPRLFVHSVGMGEVLPMPAFGDLFTDVRGGDRTMRVSYHGDVGVVVVSLWLGPVCRGSFRMAAGDLSRLISTLSEI